MIEIINNKPLTKSSSRQKELFEEWLLRQSPKTRITYSFSLKKFLCFLNENEIVIRNVNEITSKMILIYSEKLKNDNLSNKYINLQISVISSCLNYYFQEQIIPSNSANAVRRPPNDVRKLKQVLSVNEIERLEQAFRPNESHLKTLFIVLEQTGQRISSILNLKKSDILELQGRRIIKLKIKREKLRLLPLTRKAEAVLMELAKDKNEDEYIFTARNSTQVISICAFNKTLKRKAKKAKVKKTISSHVFRRTLINGLIEKGHSLDSIKNGVSFHSDIQTLYSYRVNEQQDLINNPILKNEYLKSDEKDTYKTPRYLIERLEKEFGQFTLDAAANDENKICDRYISKEENALVSEWTTSGIVFCNPPYSQKQQFLDKAIEQAKSGQKIIMLVPASPETEFFRSCKDKSDWLLCLNGRLVFDGVGNSNAGQAKFATMLVFFNREKTEKLNDLGWSI